MSDEGTATAKASLRLGNGFGQDEVRDDLIRQLTERRER